MAMGGCTTASQGMRNAESSIHVLVYSHCFWPSLGGVETYVRLLAEGLAEDQAFRTTVVTETHNAGPDPEWKFRILRRPGLLRLWSIIRAADAVLIAGPA